jgi:hypothetical protein
MTRRALFLAIAVFTGIFLVAGTVWWLRNGFERVETEVDVGFRGAARANPLLAVEHLYTSLGATARTLPGAAREMPPVGHALVVVSPKRSLSERRLREILAWVQRGGRLVIALDEAPALDPILQHFGVHTVSDPAAKRGTDILTVPLRGGGVAKVQVAKAPRLHDQEAAAFSAGPPQNRFLLRFDVDNGRVTILSDATFLTNEQIGREDHARLAWALVQGAVPDDPPRGVWIVVREDLPTLTGLLARHAWAASLSSLLLLGAWLWSAGARFGPVLPDPPLHRRSLLEHIEASGDFLLRTGRGEDLAQSARQALLHRIELREPGWAKLPLPELAQRLGGLPGLPKLPAARIESALRGPVANPADLTVTVQILETLRRSL